MHVNPHEDAEHKGEITSREHVSIVRRQDLSHLIRSKRWAERLTLEEAAKIIGVSAATLSRWERGGVQSGTRRGQVERGDEGKSIPEPDTRTLAALTKWLGVSIDRVVDREARQQDIVDRTPSTVDTLDIIEAHLRADRNLDAQSAELLARLFRVAYEQFSGSGNTAPPVEETGQANDPDPMETK
ncbi:MAG TPA: helix-turn-helix transcriptional regulator [Chloroflexia bacterium]|jgi:transcriptional regulator with XRE-family HTH domain